MMNFFTKSSLELTIVIKSPLNHHEQAQYNSVMTRDSTHYRDSKPCGQRFLHGDHQEVTTH